MRQLADDSNALTLDRVTSHGATGKSQWGRAENGRIRWCCHRSRTQWAHGRGLSVARRPEDRGSRTQSPHRRRMHNRREPIQAIASICAPTFSWGSAIRHCSTTWRFIASDSPISSRQSSRVRRSATALASSSTRTSTRPALRLRDSRRVMPRHSESCISSTP
jgi:hypothetical protein